MKLAKDVSLVAAVAVLTALLTGPLLGPTTADAVDEVLAPAAPAAVPVLTTGGLQLSLTLDRETYEAGQTPVVLFKVVNDGEKTADLKAHVRMTSLGREMFASRMPPRPAERFSTPISLRLEPGETRLLELPTNVKLEAGSQAFFEIEAGTQRIVGADVTLPAPDGAAPTLRLPRLTRAPLETLEVLKTETAATEK